MRQYRWNWTSRHAAMEAAAHFADSLPTVPMHHLTSEKSARNLVQGSVAVQSEGALLA